MKINKDVIKKLNPCKDRYYNYLKHYSDFNGSVSEFLELSEISHSDKLWVCLRLMDRFSVEVFAIDCAASAAYDASAAASAAAYAASANERERQLDAILYLMEGEA